MLKFKSRHDIIGGYADAGKPMDQETIDALESVAAELKALGYDDNWVVFEGQCRICNNEHTVICPASNDLDNQECANCGNMSMQEKEIPEWEQP